MSRTTSLIVAQSQGPSELLGVPSRCTNFFANRKHAIEHSIGGTHSGQMHVEFYQPLYPVAAGAQKNIVLLHGDCFTGETWHAKADGSQGWGAYFLNHGYNVFVVDLPGVGKSKFLHPNDYQVPGSQRTVRSLGADLIEQEFTASEQIPLPDGSLAWPSAAKHTQWPGTGRRGDPTFEKLIKSTTSMVLPKLQHEELGAIALRDLLEQIGPSFLLGLGTGATIAMLTADAVPRLVRGLISIEPDGPPCAVAGKEVNGRMIYSPYLQYDPNIRKYGISDAPPTFSPALQPAPGEHPLKIQVRQLQQNSGCYMAQQTQENVLIYKRRPDEGQDKVPQLIQLATVPHIIINSQSSPHSTYDWAIVIFLRAAGAIVDYCPLAANEITGNGHLMHQEKNSDGIAQLIDGWVTRVPIRNEDDEREQRIASQIKRQLLGRSCAPMNGPRDEPYELEIVVQSDGVKPQASAALPTALPSPVTSVDATGSDTSVDPTGLVTSVDLTGSAILVDATGPITSVDPVGPVDTLDPRMFSFDLSDEIEEQATRPYQAPDQAWGPYPSSNSFRSAEIGSFDTANTDIDMLLDWTPSLVQDEMGLSTAGIPETEDMFNNEWMQFLNEDLVQKDFFL